MRVSSETLLVPEVEMTVGAWDPVSLQDLVVVFEAVLVHVQHVLVSASAVLAS